MAQKKSMIVLALASIMFLMSSATFAAGSDALVGTWRLLAEGATAPVGVIITFHEGGTASASSPFANFSLIHGTWEKVGANDYAMKTSSYRYDASGNVEILVNSVELITLTDDGQTYTTEINSVISSPDGTVIATPPTVVVNGTRDSLDL